VSKTIENDSNWTLIGDIMNEAMVFGYGQNEKHVLPSEITIHLYPNFLIIRHWVCFVRLTYAHSSHYSCVADMFFELIS
jgi:hypothetical protein